MKAIFNQELFQLIYLFLFWKKILLTKWVKPQNLLTKMLKSGRSRSSLNPWKQQGVMEPAWSHWSFHQVHIKQNWHNIFLTTQFLGDQISRVSKMLADEYGTASNIKSRVNRLSVLGAITSVQQRLKLYSKVQTNGLVRLTHWKLFFIQWFRSSTAVP